jgi:hypothetical protein
VITNEALRWALAALLLTAAGYAAVRAASHPARARRVDYGLHAVMMVAMVNMLAPGSRWPVLPQLLLLALGAWWFVVRAAAVRPARAGSTMSLYDALSMAAAAYMLTAMDFSAAHGPAAAGHPSGAAHHGSATAPGFPLPGPGPDWPTQPALVLAVVFGLAGVAWAVPALRGLRSRAPGMGADAALHVVGAASMALMFAALAA